MCGSEPLYLKVIAIGLLPPLEERMRSFRFLTTDSGTLACVAAAFPADRPRIPFAPNRRNVAIEHILDVVRIEDVERKVPLRAHAV